MSKMKRRWAPEFSMALLLAGGFVVLALLVLAPNYAQARLDGAQPVPLQSGLQADYSADPMDLMIQPVDIRVVEQVIKDRTTVTSLPAKQQGETAISALQTPVYTITPTPIQPGSAAASPTPAAQNLTNTAPAFTPTGTSASTKIVPLTPTAGVFTASPSATHTLTSTATRTVAANSTRTATASASHTPRPTSTLAPTPRGTKATPTPKATATRTPPPATAVVTRTFTPTPTAVTVQPPTRTFTPTYTYTATYTPTRTYTATKTPTRTPTLINYPPPPTITRTPTVRPYP